MFREFLEFKEELPKMQAFANLACYDKNFVMLHFLNNSVHNIRQATTLHYITCLLPACFRNFSRNRMFPNGNTGVPKWEHWADYG